MSLRMSRGSASEEETLNPELWCESDWRNNQKIIQRNIFNFSHVENDVNQKRCFGKNNFDCLFVVCFFILSSLWNNEKEQSRGEKPAKQWQTAQGLEKGRKSSLKKFPSILSSSILQLLS